MPPKVSKDELRAFAKAAIRDARKRQEAHWNSLHIDVLAANAEFNGREHQIILAKIDELANAETYPLWMDAIIAVGITVIPINWALDRIAKRIALSRKLPLLTKEMPRFTAAQRIGGTQKAAATISLNDVPAMKSVMQKAVPAESKLRERAFDVGRVLRPEIEDGLRTVVSTAAKATVAPLYANNWVSGNANRQKSAPAATGLPSVTVFKGLLQWIEMSKSSDLEILELLMDDATHGDDEDFLRTLPDYLVEEAAASSHRTALEKAPDEFFQRFVEACLWCTTYDFTPSYSKAKKGTTRYVKGDKIIVGAAPPLAHHLPLPKPVWENFISRHYDPFIGRGDKTYEELGSRSYIAPERSFPPVFGEANEFLAHAGSLDPKTRLSIHWSGILAPALRKTNQEITAALDAYLPPR